jgi:type IV fimbrial biogenesis protein FimT
MSQRQGGFNLLELMTSVLVLAIMVSTGVPSFSYMLSKRRLVAAAEETLSNLRLLRVETVRHNRNAYASFTGAGQLWSYGLDDTAGCDPGVAGDCTVDGNERRVQSGKYPGVTMSTSFAGNSTGFEPRRGTALSGGAVSFQNDAGELHVEVSLLGSVRLCTPSGSNQLWGYPAC